MTRKVCVLRMAPKYGPRRALSAMRPISSMRSLKPRSVSSPDTAEAAASSTITGRAMAPGMAPFSMTMPSS